MDEKLLEKIVAEVMKALGKDDEQVAPDGSPCPAEDVESSELFDLDSPQAKARVLVEAPEDYDAIVRMKSKTTARIGVGRAGGRLNTQTMLALRADHAAAKDAVFRDVDEGLLEKAGLFTVQTKCADKNQFLTRPDLGRAFSDEALQTVREKCKPSPEVQLIVSDGLSSTAVTANVNSLLPALTDGLKSRGIDVGTTFFVKYGRVAAEDAIAEALGAKVVCILIGERPGLATAESMSAYIAYDARVGMPEARRTVVSNIHRDGIAAVEAGAYLAELIEKILKAKKSGV